MQILNSYNKYNIKLATNVNSKIMFMFDIFIWKIQKNKEDYFSFDECKLIYNKIIKIKESIKDEIIILDEIINFNIEHRSSDDLLFDVKSSELKILFKNFFKEIIFKENGKLKIIDFMNFQKILNKYFKEFIELNKKFNEELIQMGLDLSDRYIEYQKMIAFYNFKINLQEGEINDKISC